MELSNLIEKRGPTDETENIRVALQAVEENADLIKLTLAVLMFPE